MVVRKCEIENHLKWQGGLITDALSPWSGSFSSSTNYKPSE